ncbi:Kv channel-interacting protein 1 [Aphelenchoides fujianensis]|nr:Kv channel-interacting protein 1 [Aphelenchoides fujianensis]
MHEMFGQRNTFLNDSTRSHGHRRRSQVQRNVRICFAEPPVVSSNPLIARLFAHFYWSVRRAQFKIFYRTEEADAQSLTDLIKFEPTERPPSLKTLLELTHNRFEPRWIKYLYQRFKNECPTGRMNMHAFRQVFGSYLPNRMSDAYFDRLFNAFLHASNHPDQLTFKDLLMCLSLLHNANSRTKAEWTMRLINGSTSDRIQFEDFESYVRSVFLLNGPQIPTAAAAAAAATAESAAEPSAPTEQTLLAADNRASVIFKELDTQNRHYLLVEDLEAQFKARDTKLI